MVLDAPTRDDSCRSYACIQALSPSRALLLITTGSADPGVSSGGITVRPPKRNSKSRIWGTCPQHSRLFHSLILLVAQFGRILAEVEEMNTQKSTQLEIVWHMWPIHDMVHGRLVQVGIELELAGSHCADPGHIDPGCTGCRRLGTALHRLASEVAEKCLDGTGTTLRCSVHALHCAAVQLPHQGDRWFVPVNVEIRDCPKIATAPGGASALTDVLGRFRRALQERGVNEK